MDELNDLSIAQLEELIEEQDDDGTRGVLSELLQRRRDLENLVQQQEASRPRRKSRGGIRTTEPKGRALDAAQAFANDPERMQVWQEAVSEATDDDGNVQLTGRIIQLAIGAYYAQRREEKRLHESQPNNETRLHEPQPNDEEVQAEAEATGDDDMLVTVADDILSNFDFDDADDWNPAA